MFCFENCAPDTRGERGRKGRECKFKNKAHRTFHPRNTLRVCFQSRVAAAEAAGVAEAATPPQRESRETLSSGRS